MKRTAADLERLVEIVTSEVYQKLHESSAARGGVNLSQNLYHPPGTAVGFPSPATTSTTPTPTPTPIPAPTEQSTATVAAPKISSAENLSPAQLASMIDHTLLKPDVSSDQIKKLCEEAAQYKFATVCVNSSNVGLAAKLLEGTGVKAIAVVGFPLGAATTASKAFETLEAIRAGAKEIDMVINIGALKGKDYKLVLEDIKSVVDAAGRIPVKVILETSNLRQEEKIIGCVLSKAAGAAFVKTSTGFGGGGATVEDIKLMRHTVGPEMGVKASGGVRTREDALKMINAGANRVGASSSVEIVTGQKSSGKGY